jgi:ribosomal protein S18 acetylase RimI-like enzyme
MSWELVGRKEMDSVLSFLLRDEALCVPFTSRIRAGARGCEIFRDINEDSAVKECFLFSSTGLLLPMLSPLIGQRRELAGLLLELRPLVHSIMGIGSSVTGIEELLPLPPTTHIDYFLMTLAREKMLPVMPYTAGDLFVRRADSYDAEAIFPLQKGYELEEVVISPAHYSDGQCMRLLRNALRDEIVFVAELDGIPVAKAATNARGFGVDQIGGVYTAPEHRGKGLGALVVEALLRAVFKEKNAACLFVKKRNRPALALYERLGFTPITDYAISYYGV